VQINSHLRRIKPAGGSSGVSGKILIKKLINTPKNEYSYDSDTHITFEVEEQETVEGSLFNVFENI